MFFDGVAYKYIDMTKKHFCEKCGKRIKIKETPWCLNCRLMEINKQKKVAENKPLIKMSDEKENKSGEETDAEEEAEETIDNLPDIDEEGEIL